MKKPLTEKAVEIKSRWIGSPTGLLGSTSAFCSFGFGAGGPLAPAGFLGGTRERFKPHHLKSIVFTVPRFMVGLGLPVDGNAKVSSENCNCWQSGQCLACAVPYEYG